MIKYKNRKFIYFLVLILVLMMLVGCSSGEEVKEDTISQPLPIGDGIESEEASKEEELSDSIKEAMDEDTSNPEATEEETIEGENVNLDGMEINPLTGLYVDESVLERRPIAVMQDNHYAARPQAGIGQADVAYEILAEGLITRYLAIYYGEYPDNIGGVRSARPYYIDKAIEFDPYYVHVGGSEQGKEDIKTLQMADIDGLYSGAFWRVDQKYIPHNMYTSSEAILEDANNKGYRTTSELDFLNFNEEFTALGGEEVSSMKIIYKEPSSGDSVGYYSSYKYNEEERVYYRSTNGEAYYDENTGEQVTCTNVIIQYADHRIIDDVGRREVDLVGSGEAKYYSGGEMINVTWEKATRTAPTKFYDEDGKSINLNPGKTWFQVVDYGMIVY